MIIKKLKKKSPVEMLTARQKVPILYELIELRCKPSSLKSLKIWYDIFTAQQLIYEMKLILKRKTISSLKLNPKKEQTHRQTLSSFKLIKKFPSKKSIPAFM